MRPSPWIKICLTLRRRRVTICSPRQCHRDAPASSICALTPRVKTGLARNVQFTCEARAVPSPSTACGRTCCAVARCMPGTNVLCLLQDARARCHLDGCVSAAAARITFISARVDDHALLVDMVARSWVGVAYFQHARVSVPTMRTASHTPYQRHPHVRFS